MDAVDVFRQGLGSVIPRQNHHLPSSRKTPIIPTPSYPHLPDDRSESEGPPHRIAHTLTACCRCRLRKSRCDPTLPRCLPCERSGSTCEYFDTAKGKKINRLYVVKLQEKVRQLEAELAQYTEEESEYPRDNEEIVRPGGLIRLGETDETPRYLGPSSGISIMRIVVEEAKRYTESRSISDLVPELRARRQYRSDRMQSVVGPAAGPNASSSRKKSQYPMTSAHPAKGLPTRPVADKLVEVFNQRAQLFCPVLHEQILAKDIDAVFSGDKDPLKNFMVHMVMAISLQKLDTQYAGLADSYYLAAMQHFEDVIRCQDLKTLQCLVLTCQYSLLTPTRTAVYYVVGLTTRICQQLGLGEEKTLSAGHEAGLMDPLTLDMRRRISWIVTANELGLAHSMGRPNGFAKGNDVMDVQFFSTARDENITTEGVKPGPPCERKLIAVHFFKMRVLQAEIRRVLYEKKRAEPKHESHPWYSRMEEKLSRWKDASPETPEWCRPWFAGRYHQMIISLYRPSPQVPQPTGQAASRCFDSAAFVISLSSQQVKRAAVDMTWVFLLVIYMALNTLLWAVSYPDVRAAHSRDEAEGVVNTALDIIDQCAERWPGTAAASQLYAVFAKACLRSYEAKQEPRRGGGDCAANASPSLTNTASPASGMSTPTSSSTVIAAQSQGSHQRPAFSPPNFGQVFNSTPQLISTTYNYDADPPPQPHKHPTFRSNSIFLSPATDHNGRRLSDFAPDFPHNLPHHGQEAALRSQPGDSAHILGTHYAIHQHPQGPPPLFGNQSTPPVAASAASATSASPEPLPVQSHRDSRASDLPATPSTIKTESARSTPTIPYTHPTPEDAYTAPMRFQNVKYEPGQQVPNPQAQPPPRPAAFTIPPPPQHDSSRRRPAEQPTTVTDWFNPPPPFISPYAFSSVMSGGYWQDEISSAAAAAATTAPIAGLGMAGPGTGYSLAGDRFRGFPPGPVVLSGADGLIPFSDGGAVPLQYVFPPERNGSLSVEQQVELMDVLETEGVGEIDAFLNMGVGAELDTGVSWG